VAPEAKKSLKSQPAMAEEMEEEGEALVAEDNAAAVAERVAIIKEAAKKSKMKHDDDDHEDDDDDKCMKEEEEFELSEELEAFINEGIEAGLSEEEILAAIDENFEIISEEEELEESAVEDYQVDMSEHVDALLAGEDLSEEFHAKATTIFEAAVKAKLEEEVALLEQAYAETLEERVAEIQAQLAEDVDNYLNYVVEQWIEENEVAVESALRSELTEDFISGLRSLFAEHYIDIPEDSVNVVEELSQTVESLEAKINEEINRNVELTSMISESRKSELTSYVCEGLTTTQAEKLKSLVEGVEYSNDDEFITKISTLRENYFPATVKTDNVLDKVEVSDDPQALVEGNLNGPMAKYVQAIGKTKLI
jgi:DNA-binding transcriptional regulator YhcF (GntR family)